MAVDLWSLAKDHVTDLPTTIRPQAINDSEDSVPEKPIPDQRSDRYEVLRGILHHRRGPADGYPVLGAVGRSIRAASVEGLPARMEAPLPALPELGEVKFGVSEKEVESRARLPEARNRTYTGCTQQAHRPSEEIQKQITDLSAKILAVQNVFTDRRAYVNALTYQMETSNSASSKQSIQKELDSYKARTATVKFPDGTSRDTPSSNSKSTYNDLKTSAPSSMQNWATY